MSAMAVLIPLGIVMGAVGLGAFLWSLRNGQYEDLDGAAARILSDDDEDDAPRQDDEPGETRGRPAG